ncbi:MAG: nicotinate (nicotinamide) nucleotide adenylyltransferase [Clostridia bacterium]|nr:nicotinate (nicotinamide) nucleotide adenylyltransferase [Clostridia bacterium]
MKTGIFGGTFNPPHEGHAEAARAVMRALSLDRIIFVPTAQPPHKALPRFSATEEQRLCMTRLMAESVEGASVSDIEILRGGVNYTADTLSEFKKLYPEDELYLLMGTDMLLSFGAWKRPADICALASLAVFRREENDLEKIKAAAKETEKAYGGRVCVIENDPIVFSSTKARGGDRQMLSPAVEKYVSDHCLYVDTDALCESVKGRLSEKRYAHTLGVASLSCELARIYGEEENRAFCAAVLHDCAKEMPLSEQLSICEKYGVKQDYDEDNLKELIHADTAAALAKAEYNMCDDVCRAIKYHTTGNDEMTLLDKIIYVADACEENRKWDKAPALREQAKRDLDGAVVFLLDETVKRLEKNGKKPYYRTRTALCAAKDTERKKKMADEPVSIVKTAVKAADAKKASDITVLKVAAQTTLADYFVIMTGMTGVHLRALSEEIEKKLKEEGVTPHHIEGVTSSWILMDYGGAVINIFLQDAREMYALERLWGDAETVDINTFLSEDEEK